MRAGAASNKVFRSTPLREGRLDRAGRVQIGPMFRSTPLREGRREAGAIRGGGLIVSIHAPAGGAT